MHRATLANALNIATKLDSADGYKFDELCLEMQKYVKDCLAQNKIDCDKCYSILSALNKALKAYNSTFNYSKAFIIDDFLIQLWDILDKGI